MSVNETHAEATTEKSSAVGNEAAMREALTPWISLAEWLIKNAGKDALGNGISEIVPQLRRRIDESRAALAKPPRNCDVGTAEEQAQRFERFCAEHRGHICRSCPFRQSTECELAWAQMPYTEGGEE